MVVTWWIVFFGAVTLGTFASIGLFPSMFHSTLYCKTYVVNLTTIAERSWELERSLASPESQLIHLFKVRCTRKDKRLHIQPKTQHKKASNHHANLPLEMYSFTL